jgi:putative regulator of septum formation
MWWMRVLLIVVTIAAVAASVVVILQMNDRSAANAPSADTPSGNCLTWPPGEPERARQVDCGDEHLFEVAGSEPGDAADAARSQQTCARAVANYLGPRYDPGGRFVVGAVSTPGRLMCGLQLPSIGIASVGFKGLVADQDQSNVWPTGTCLGIREGETTDVAVDCGLPHALEITGTVDLSTKFGQAAPATAAQDAVVRDACGAATSAYLSPSTLDATSLAVRYQPIEAAGWAAGSRRIACRVGSPKPDGGWNTLVRSAKNGVRIDGQRPVTVPSPAVAPPAETPPPAEAPAPADESAPDGEPTEPSSADEVPVLVNRDTDESTDVAGPVPHMDGSEGLGPVPHMAGSAVPGPVPHMVGPLAPGPALAPASTSQAPLADSGSSTP